MRKLSSRTRKWLTGSAIALAVVLVTVYLLAPFLTKTYLNRYVLADIGSYTGHVDKIGLRIFKGTYAMHDLAIYRKGGNKEVPFFYVKDFFVYLSWDALKEGAILVSATLDEPELNFLDAKKEDDRQSGEGGNWMETLEELVPTTVHELRVSNGKMTFQNFDTEPKADIRAQNINAKLSNLTNVKDKQGQRVATLELEANLFDESKVFATARFDPFDYNDFNFVARAEGIELVNFNSFSKAYGNIDFEDGSGDVFCEIRAEGGEISGYIKPLFTDVNVLSWKQDVKQQGDNPFQLLWEGGVGFLKTLLTNAETDKVATIVEISGSVESTEVDSWKAVGTLVKNAFVNALQTRFERFTSLSDD